MENFHHIFIKHAYSQRVYFLVQRNIQVYSLTLNIPLDLLGYNAEVMVKATKPPIWKHYTYLDA